APRRRPLAVLGPGTTARPRRPRPCPGGYGGDHGRSRTAEPPWHVRPRPDGRRCAGVPRRTRTTPGAYDEQRTDVRVAPAPNAPVPKHVVRVLVPRRDRRPRGRHHARWRR